MVGKTLASEPVPDRDLRIYVAGGIALRGPDGTTVGERSFGSRQARRLFVRLVAIHEPVSQADLADDLWGPAWPAAWHVALRALISKLRSNLTTVGARDVLSSRDAAYALHLPGDAWLDLDAAGEAVHRAEGLLSNGDPAAASGWALGARAITSRPLLPGDEGEWLETLRRRSTDVRLRALECLGEAWIALGDPALAARDAVEAINVDPFRETAHRLLIRAHLALGDQGAAVKAFDACRQVLDTELGVAPSPATHALVAHLTDRAIDPPSG